MLLLDKIKLLLRDPEQKKVEVWRLIHQNKTSCFQDVQSALKCGQLILRKIINNAATRRHIIRTKARNAISAEAPPQTPLGGAHSAPPDPLAGFKGAYF